MQKFFTQSRRILCSLLLTLGILATGCATSQYGEQITTVAYYPQCYAPIQALRDADAEFNKTVGISTGMGILGGALIGLLATGKAEGALIGAAAGGVAGAGLGYAKARQERIADDNKRMASYLVDLEGDISGVDRATAAARTARDCYNRQFRQAIDDYKAGRMPRQELTDRYTEIKNGCVEAGNILGSVIAVADDKERDYQEAVRSEAQRAGRSAPPVQTAAAVQPKPSDPKPVARSAAAPQGKAGAGKSAEPAQADKPIIQKTAAPRRGDTSLEAVAQNTQRLGESKQSAIEEQESIRKMQEEMDGTLATILS